jgi:hypothetical protein
MIRPEPFSHPPRKLTLFNTPTVSIPLLKEYQEIKASDVWTFSDLRRLAIYGGFKVVLGKNKTVDFHYRREYDNGTAYQSVSGAVILILDKL